MQALEKKMATKEDLADATAQNKVDLDAAVAKMASKEDLKLAMDALLDTMKKGFEDMNRRFDSLERPYLDQIHGRLNMHREASPPLTPDTPVLPVLNPAAEIIARVECDVVVAGDFFAKVPDTTRDEDITDDLAAREAADIFALVNDMVDGVVRLSDPKDTADEGMRVRIGFPASF